MFTREGKLYDRHGIAPDVGLEPEPGYFLEGARDGMLERARDLARG